MPFSLNLTPFDHFQMCPTFAVTPNLILEPCHMGVPDLLCPISALALVFKKSIRPALDP